jgi:hypothetical protein
MYILKTYWVQWSDYSSIMQEVAGSILIQFELVLVVFYVGIICMYLQIKVNKYVYLSVI